MLYDVRPLTSLDGAALDALFEQDPMRFLTPRMNLEVYGYDSTAVRPWGAFVPGTEEAVGVMLRYSNTMIVADRDGATAPTFATVIDQEHGVAGVRGTSELVRRLRPHLRRYNWNGLEQSVFMVLQQPARCMSETLRLARRASSSDLDMLADLYAGAGAMFRTRANVADKLAHSRVFVVEEPARAGAPMRIVACALLNMENFNAGLIGGVFTHPSARGRGYAAACTAALSLDLQQHGKLPCLFYENPVAGKVYRRLGFEEVGYWAVLYLTGGKPGSSGSTG